jgi:hypothetical protein
MIACAADLRSLETIRVAPSEVIYAFLSLAGEPSDLDEVLLDDEERARATRFVRPPDRHRFVLAHAALRLFLARCLDIHPDAVHYEHASMASRVWGRVFRRWSSTCPTRGNWAWSRSLGIDRSEWTSSKCATCPTP